MISKFITLTMVFCGCCSPSFAGDKDYQKEGVAFVKKQIGEIKKLKLEEVLEHKENLKAPKGEAVEGESCEGCVANLENPEELEKKIREEMRSQKEEQNGKIVGKEGDRILVFVSFSMPNNSIKELSGQASKYGAQLLIRGIFEGSFKQTGKKILEIDEKGLSLEINPNEFKKYKIEKVPTFVLIKAGIEIARLSGNVSLEYANTKLREG